MSALGHPPASPASDPWRDTTLSPAQRVDALIDAMTLDEKVGQLFGVWVGASDDGGEVAPHQHEMNEAADLESLLPHGIGQLTRPFGTRPVDAAVGAVSLMRSQQRIAAANRFGIPAVAHEECLAGFAAWGATAYPVPVSWAATFDPPLIEEMARRIGADMRAVGIHQGLAPVFDVVRDLRWGRVEETMGEDPYLVGITGSAYVRGLEKAGIVATLKHFAGYSASKAGRNLAPVSMGPTEFADVVLAPFEMAVREASPRSVMCSYSDVDGVPAAADGRLMTELLRDTWGFTGTVVADYFAVAFLAKLHGVAANLGDAARQALEAGVDVELPNPHAFLEPLHDAVRDGSLAIETIDRALRRVLLQKVELGLLDPDWSPVPQALADADLTDPEALRGSVNLDPDDNREIARRIAEQSAVLLRNDGTLPLSTPTRIAVVGPAADFEFGVLGCYSFPAHIGVRYPGTPTGIRIPTLLESIAAEFPTSVITHVPGTTLDGGETDGFAQAIAAAQDADVVVLALGDRAGLFGRGTSGEGCDVEDLSLPAAQGALLEAVLDSGTPTIVTLLAGRPYALGTAPERASAVVQTFFPGEAGTEALAGVLSGRVGPSGRLPVSVPSRPGSQPATYLAAPLARAGKTSNLDPSAAYPFGHGLTYTSFAWDNAHTSTTATTTDGEVTLEVTVRNTGARDGVDVVQLYLHDPVASVVRPVQRLVGFARVELDAGASAVVSFAVPMDLAAFTGRCGRKIVEPGALTLSLGRSSEDLAHEFALEVTGEERTVDHTRALHPRVSVS